MYVVRRIFHSMTSKDYDELISKVLATEEEFGFNFNNNNNNDEQTYDVTQSRKCWSFGK
jgi:hypothetical protein